MCWWPSRVYSWGYWQEGKSAKLKASPSGNHAFELSVGYLHSEMTEEWPQAPGRLPRPGPYTISSRAIPVEAVYRYRFSSLQVKGFAPLAGLGATWTLVEDTWTPVDNSTTSAFGGIAFLGIQANVTGRVAAVARGAYRGTIDTGERFVQHIGLDGFSAQAGLQISF